MFILLTYPLQKEDIVKISVEKNGELYEIKSVKRRNPYIMKITVPETLTEVTAIVNVLVEKNGSIIGSRPIKCESRLRELEQILRSTNNPVEFMCQVGGGRALIPAFLCRVGGYSIRSSVYAPEISNFYAKIVKHIKLDG